MNKSISLEKRFKFGENWYRFLLRGIVLFFRGELKCGGRGGCNEFVFRRLINQ